MNEHFAFVFPGQGSQHLGMLNELGSKFSVIPDVFHRASDVLGHDLWKLCQEGPEEKLNQTEYTQPILLTAGVAIWELWKTFKAPLPKFLAGHSLGEYTALVCANALSFESAVQLVAKRGKLMQEAVLPGEGAMAALVGLDEKTVQEICQSSSSENEWVSPANFNSPEQIVIAGNTNAVERALALANEKKVKLAKKLSVSVPSHCALMRPAAERFKEAIYSITWKSPERHVIHNVDACSHTETEKIRDSLVRQLYSPVRWVESIQYIGQQLPKIIIESGPNRVLTGLNRRIGPQLKTVAITHPDSLQEALNSIGA